MTDSSNIVYEIVAALAEEESVSPQELSVTLAEYIDPALLEMLTSSDTASELSFRVESHEVTVTSAGAVFVDGTRYRNGTHPQVTDDERGGIDLPEHLQLQRFFDNFPCTVYRSRNEPGWPIEFISERCRELTGYDPNAFIVGGVTFGFDVIHPDDRERVFGIVQESVQNEESFSVIYRIQTAENTEKWVMEIGVGLFDEEQPISFVGTIIDITDLKADLDVPRNIRV